MTVKFPSGLLSLYRSDVAVSFSSVPLCIHLYVASDKLTALQGIVTFDLSATVASVGCATNLRTKVFLKSVLKRKLITGYLYSIT